MDETTHGPKHGDVRAAPPGAQVYLDGRDEDGVQVAPEGWYEIGCRVGQSWGEVNGE